MSGIKASAYVRSENEYLSEQAPPQNTQGLVGWIRQNLLSTWSDRIITVVFGSLFLWFAWSALDSWFLSANWAGKTQAEGQLAEIITNVDHKIKEAHKLERNWEALAIDLAENEDRNLATLVQRISVTDLTVQPTVVRLGLEQRVIPSKIDDMITIAQSKLPLSVYARLAVIRRQLMDPRVEKIEGLEDLKLTTAEKKSLIEASRPWKVLNEKTKEQFQISAKNIDTILKKSEKINGQKVYASIDSVRPQLDEILAAENAENFLEKPTQVALQFASLVDSVVGTPMTNIPTSRIQKLRKDSLTPTQINSVRMQLASEIVGPPAKNLSGFQLKAHNKRVEQTALALTDAEIFLNSTMPVGLPEAIENQGLLRALSVMNFWDVAMTLAEPTGEASSVAANEVLTSYIKAPLVYRALLENFEHAEPGPESYAGSTRKLIKAYLDKNLDSMEIAWDNFSPLRSWASGKDGSNWAVIVKNWDRLLWGTYPGESLWRVAVVGLLFLVALLPILVPACRNIYFYSFSAVYPLLLLFLLGGLSIRLYGFSGAEDASFMVRLYSEYGRVLQAVIALFVVVGTFFLQRSSLGKTAGPALIVVQILSVLYMIIMLWGTVINPKAAQSNILVETGFTGLLTAENQPEGIITVQSVQAEIDRLNAEADSDQLSDEEAQAKRVAAIAMKPDLAKARTAERDFNNVVAKGKGTFVILPFIKSAQWGGLLVTMVLGVLGMAASLPIGIALAFGRQSTLPIIRWFSTSLIEITRGVPLIALLLVVTFVLPKLLPEAEYPKLGLVFVAICLFGGAYQAEVVRGGLQALPKGQYEAAQAMGLNFWQMSRLITLPQALKAVIPAIVNTFIGLFKDTTLVIIVGIFDFLTVAEMQITAKNAWNGTKPETLLVISLVFFVLMFSLSRYSMWLERRLAVEHR